MLDLINWLTQNIQVESSTGEGDSALFCDWTETVVFQICQFNSFHPKKLILPS